MKYSIGQSVMVKFSNRWIGDYEAACIIEGYENYVVNAIPVYIIKNSNGCILNGIIETEISEARK